MAHFCLTVSLPASNDYLYQISFLHQESTCIQVCPDYGKNLLFLSAYLLEYLLECKYGHFYPMSWLETKLAVCSPQVLRKYVQSAVPSRSPRSTCSPQVLHRYFAGTSQQQDLLKYIAESCVNCNWCVIVNICGIFRFALQ